MDTQKPAPKTKCHYGHTFGNDIDKYEDCDACEAWDDCSEYQLSVKPKKKSVENPLKKKEPITINMEETLKQLRAMLTCEKFIITGSLALKKYGLTNKSDDIDIILVHPTDETMERLKKLQEEMPAATKAQLDSEKYEDSSLLAIFKWNGVKVDVFGSDGEPSFNLDGFEYAMLLNIVKAKQEANRLKDWLQLRKLASQFWTRESMAKWLDEQERTV